MTTGRPITEHDLQAHVDLALDASRRAEVDEYLVHHPEVARRVAAHAAQRAGLRAALASIADEPVPPELSLARLLEIRRPLRRPVSGRTMVAALVLLGLGGGAGWALRGVSQPASSGISALAQEATDSYRVYVPDRIHPVELHAGERGELERWVSDRLQHPVSVPDLASAGYRFMGGRVVATAHGPAGLLMYDDDRGTRLVVLIRPMAVERDTPMALYASGPVRGYSWAQRGIGYSVVAAASADALHPLADEVRRQTAAG